MRGIGSKFGVVLGLTAAGALGLFGCASYTNVPEAGRVGEAENVNAWGTRAVLASAITEVVETHPARDAQGRYVVNFPVGTYREQALRVIQDLPSGAMLPGEGGAEGAPVYHVARLWLRASSAKVDVVFPSTVEGKTLERAVTVWMRGGPMLWDVQRMQYWAPGVITTPGLYVPVWEDELRAQRETEKAAMAMESPVDGENEHAGGRTVEPVSGDESEGDGSSGGPGLYREVDD